MKASVKIYNLNSSNDINIIRNLITSKEGIIACEINRSKKEIQIVYDNRIVNLDEIINLIEMTGYMVQN